VVAATTSRRAVAVIIVVGPRNAERPARERRAVQFCFYLVEIRGIEPLTS
jgi:hypothetical protein